jgi:hypothetical protein
MGGICISYPTFIDSIALIMSGEKHKSGNAIAAKIIRNRAALLTVPVINQTRLFLSPKATVNIVLVPKRISGHRTHTKKNRKRVYINIYNTSAIKN